MKEADDTQESLNDRIVRHLRGERVTTEYIDTNTGQVRHIAEGDPVPPGHFPMLGEIGD